MISSEATTIIGQSKYFYTFILSSIDMIHIICGCDDEISNSFNCNLIDFVRNLIVNKCIELEIMSNHKKFKMSIL